MLGRYQRFMMIWWQRFWQDCQQNRWWGSGACRNSGAPWQSLQISSKGSQITRRFGRLCCAWCKSMVSGSSSRSHISRTPETVIFRSRNFIWHTPWPWDCIYLLELEVVTTPSTAWYILMIESFGIREHVVLPFPKIPDQVQVVSFLGYDPIGQKYI